MKYSEIKDYANKYAVPIMRDETSKLIADFVKKSNPEHILEIGTAIGYSGIIMLENSNADLTTIEHNKSYISLANKYFKNYHLKNRVKILEGDCLVILAKLASEKKHQSYFFWRLI